MSNDLKEMNKPLHEYPHFVVSDNLGAVVLSHGNDHVCLVFYSNRKRVASFASDGPGRTSFMSELDSLQNSYGDTLMEAISKAEAIAKEMKK